VDVNNGKAAAAFISFLQTDARSYSYRRATRDPRAACGNVSGESRHGGEGKRGSRERGWVINRDAEEHVPEQTRSRECAGYSNRQARQCQDQRFAQDHPQNRAV